MSAIVTYLLLVVSPLIWLHIDSSAAQECIVPPKKCPNQNITFYLYSSNNPVTPHQLDVTNLDTIRNAPFIPNAPIKFLVHGYTGHRNYAPNPQIRPAYFQLNISINVISIDYGPLVREGCYIQSVENSDLVAECTARFFEILLDNGPNIRIKQIHLIGLSLGAQVLGQVNEYFRYGQFERLTVLDPAYPLFYEYLSITRGKVDPGDAKFVDVLHTNAGLKGQLYPVGTVDFYANLGTFQPGCGITDTSCSHERSAYLYGESITSKIPFWSIKCSDLFSYIFGKCKVVSNVYGEYTDLNAKGLYFFSTTGRTPFVIPNVQ